MKEHELKTWPVFFADILAGNKTAEMRVNDRDFQMGDKLILREYDPARTVNDPQHRGYTGRKVEVEVTHVLTGEAWGVMDGFACLSIK